MSTNKMDKILLRLGKMETNPKYFTYFKSPAYYQKISLFEKINRVNLPESYKTFLSKFNGGMMVYEYQNEFMQNRADFEMHKSNSVCFLSIEEIHEKYIELKNRSWKIDRKTANPYPLLPFCSLPNNELLVFVHGEKSGKESPVFDAFHEEFPTTWGIVAPNFQSFLSKYLDSLGHPEIIGNEILGVASDYFDKPSELNETPFDIIHQMEVNKDPDIAYYHYERAVAFKHSGNFTEAYLAISKAIELDPEDAFYYFIRGEILNETHQYRAALIDYDIANKLKPDDTFYLSCRAGVLHKLYKLEPALADCNLAIKLDSKDILAYMMRKDIYISMGKNDLAEEDQNKIDELDKKN